MLYEIYFVDSGLVVYWTKDVCWEHFGAEEFKEIEAGYLPHIIATRVR